MASSVPAPLSLFHSILFGPPDSSQKPVPIPPAPAPQIVNLPASAPMNIPVNRAPTISSHGSALTRNSTMGIIGTSPPSISNSNLCESCHLRPKYHDGSKTHPYCGKTCSKKTGPSTNGSTASSNSANCDFCHKRPKYHDGTHTHPFCSKACAKSAKTAVPSATTNGTCCAPGCTKPVHANTDGSLGDYCSLAHKTLGQSVCLMCRMAPKSTRSHFCGQACADEAEKKAPLILEVPEGHVTFKSVADQFKTSWRHAGTKCPPVRRVYKIMASPASLASYKAYRSATETRGQFVAAGRSPGNENRRWHGTRRECNLGDKDQTQFCGSSTCSLCCIVRSSFDLSLWATKTGWGRFGKGIYTSSTSSKSNDYSQNKCKSPLKAILLNKVVVGKGRKMLQDSTNLTTPPPGYDSVLAETGGSLNYDELVVYTNDAIRPSFLVMYEL